RRLRDRVVVDRQVEREGAADTGRGGDVQLAAEHAGELAADRKPEAGAAVLAAGGAVGLLEGLEDDALLAGGNADAGVDHRERDDALGRVERRVARAPARGDRLGPEGHAAARRELE